MTPPTPGQGPPDAISPPGHERVRFRAQFLGLADDCSPMHLGVADLRASEASAAMREAIRMAWPPQAIGFRLLEVSAMRLGRKARPDQARVPASSVRFEPAMTDETAWRASPPPLSVVGQGGARAIFSSRISPPSAIGMSDDRKREPIQKLSPNRKDRLRGAGPPLRLRRGA
jgi:hypothetical protein